MEPSQKIIELLKNTPPVLENPQALTQNILIEINRQERNNSKRLIFRFSAYISGIAAILLLCLVLSQAVFSEKVNLQTTDSQFVEYENISVKDLNEIITQKMENRQRKEQLLAIYSQNIKY